MTPRSANGKTYTVLVCPHSGDACIDHDHHEPVAIEVAPVARIRELEVARDRLRERVAELTSNRATAIKVGDVTVYGSQESAEKVRWTLAHLKAKSNGRLT